jgi:hypothetical protein
MKDLGFLNRDSTPQTRYFEFLDRSRSKTVLADGIKEAYSDLFSINTKANELTVADVKNKLRTLYAGKRTDTAIDKIATTFRALCEYADFSTASSGKSVASPVAREQTKVVAQNLANISSNSNAPTDQSVKNDAPLPLGKMSIAGLQYHINIVLPDTRDQAVYDAIFKSLRDHIG